MTATGQLQMFEPEGKALFPLVAHYLKIHDAEFRKAENLQFCGFETAAGSMFVSSIEAFQNAQICEMAYQFETLAGLV